MQPPAQAGTPATAKGGSGRDAGADGQTDGGERDAASNRPSTSESPNTSPPCWQGLKLPLNTEV